MYASDNVRAVFRVAKAMVSDVIDLFGTEETFSDEDDAGVTAVGLYQRDGHGAVCPEFRPGCDGSAGAPAPAGKGQKRF